MLFTEPLSKKWYWETFYNFSRADNQVNRQVVDPELNNERIDNLSVFYDNTVLYNRLGSSIRYSYDGLNATVGAAAQHLQLDGAYSTDRNTPLLTDPIRRSFLNYTPNVDISYEFPSNLWLSAEYSYEINEPQLNDLQPVPNVSNPAYRIEGNPNLTPQRSHSLGLNLNYWNPASLSSVGIGSNLNLFDNQIIYNQTIELIDSIGIRTITRPDNVSGGNRFNLYLWSNFPIVKTKLTMNVNGNINLGQSPSLVNVIENETFNKGFNIRAGLNATPTQKLIFGLSGNLRFNDISYSIQEEQNQQIQNHSVDASVKWQFLSKSFFESNFNYAVYRNDRFDFNQDIPTWNASVRRIVGKQNRLEIRLAAFDIFNRRVSITQNGTQNYVVRNIAGTLARYFMLSASYNMRGYENKINKNQWW